jgi:AcrR family transcriptional regulator
MIEKTDKTLEAAKSILAKHGIRRTSMSDIAATAGVSRQTLYSRFDSKEGIVQAVISYSTDQIVDNITQAWASSDSIADKLDVFFQQAIVHAYELMQTMPDAADLFSAEHPMVSEAIQEAEKKYTQLLRTMLQPHADAIKAHGETAASVAGLITTTGYAMKHNATSVSDLRKKLITLRRMVVLMVGDQQA